MIAQKVVLKIILLVNLPITGAQVEDFLGSFGIKRIEVRVINLAVPLIRYEEENYFEKLEKAFAPADYTHVLTNPFMEGMDEWIVGLARIGGVRKLSMSVFNLVNNRGEERTLHSWFAFLHEIGHNLLCLRHSNKKCSVMDIALLYCESIEFVDFDKRGMRQIKRFNEGKVCH